MKAEPRRFDRQLETRCGREKKKGVEVNTNSFFLEEFGKIVLLLIKTRMTVGGFGGKYSKLSFE